MLKYALVETHQLGDFDYTEAPVRVILYDRCLTKFDSNGYYSEKEVKQLLDKDIPSSIGNYQLELMSDSQLQDHVQKVGRFNYLQIGIQAVDPCTVLFYIENAFMLPPDNEFGILAGGGFICSFHYSEGKWSTEGPTVSFNS